MTDFLESQFQQLDKIVASFRADIESLDGIVRAWEELPDKNTEELSAMINSAIKNKTSIEMYQDDKGQYVLDMKFSPISIVWALNIESKT